MDMILQKKSLAPWMAKLEGYDIYTPVRQDDIWNYARVTDEGDIDLDYPNTVQSLKPIIFPQRETFLEFSASDEGTPSMREVIPETKPFVVLGVRPCDARALTLYDKVFGGDIEDPYYWKRREKGILVGLACTVPPSPNCFCPTVDGSPCSTDGLDILLTELEDRYYVNSLTEKGGKLLDAAKTLFKAPTAADKKALTRIKSESEKKINRQVKQLTEVPPKLADMFDATLWDEEAMGCLRCGICTYLCPTCHCFDIADEMSSSSPLKGRRIRNWDTCQFPDFTMHSSGHNPRPDKASRLRQRILHKFHYFVVNNEAYQCTGCGRCISLCPVGIDIIEVLDKVRDYA
jgi:ferredoxin